jgi:hypothetical protein
VRSSAKPLLNFLVDAVAPTKQRPSDSRWFCTRETGDGFGFDHEAKALLDTGACKDRLPYDKRE